MHYFFVIFYNDFHSLYGALSIKFLIIIKSKINKNLVN